MKKSLCYLAIAFFLFASFENKAQTGFSISPHGYDTICHGDSILLEAVNGFVTYNWSNGKSGRFITVKTPGKYICTATDHSSNSFKDSVMLTIRPLKPLQIYTNPNPPVICGGNSHPNINTRIFIYDLRFRITIYDFGFTIYDFDIAQNSGLTIFFYQVTYSEEFGNG